jgi:hypothetical protein
MRDVLLFVLIGSSLALLVWGLLRRGRIYEYPFLAGAVFTGWLVPQAIGLYSNESLPAGGYERTLFMAVLCVVAIYVGYISCRKPLRILTWQIDDRRLLIGAAALSAFGAIFQFLIRGLDADTLGAQWTGVATIYFFFAQAQTYGYALAVIIFARTRRRFALALAVVDFAFFAASIFIGARRGLTIEISLITLLAFWFARGWVLPRIAMIGGMVFAMLFIFSVSAIRQSAFSGGHYGDSTGHLMSMEDFSRIDFVGSFESVLSKGSYELINAVYDMSATAETNSYNFGQSYWNAFVFRYVPAQLLGRDVKDALMFDLPNTEDVVAQMYGYRSPPGATPTGLNDSFAAFWFFGAGVFFAISRIMAGVYLAALRLHRVAQILYIVAIADSLHAITHESWWFFTPWIQYLMFLLPVLAWARVKRASVRGSVAPGLREQTIGAPQKVL